jgi:hypothetical protein
LLEPGACESVILDTEGLPDLDWTNFELRDGITYSHSMSSANFNLEVTSNVVETADGKRLMFTVDSFVLPTVRLPYGGQFNGRELQADVFAYFMPSAQEVSVSANSHPSGLFDVKLQVQPWSNTVDWALVDSLDQQEKLAQVAFASCSSFQESVGYAFFFSGRDNQARSYFPGPFIASPDAIDTLFKEVDDQSGVSIRSKSINSPQSLALGECVLGESIRDGDRIEWSWSFESTFQGIIGLRELNRFGGSEYTGETEERTFQTIIKGSSDISLGNITQFGENEPYVEERGDPSFPLTVLPRD